MPVEIPLLRRSARVAKREGQVIIEHLDEEVVLEGAAAELFGKILPHLDGKSLGAIAEAVAERPERVRALTRELFRAGVLSLSGPANGVGSGGAQSSVSGLEFYELHRKYVTFWLREVYAHPLWERMTSGQASRAQVLGFAFEKYHYIEGAYEHMGIAAANATPEMMPHLARHFIEEYQHGDIYRKGLRSLFPDDVVLRSQPLPSTRALVNFLSESAQKSSFGYYAGNELLQMTENTSDPTASSEIEDFYSALRRHYPYTDRIIDSFIAHTHADQKLGHESVFKEMCAAVPPLSQREVKEAMNTVRSMAEHLWLFLDGIDAFYANFPTMPRVPSDLLSQ